MFLQLYLFHFKMAHKFVHSEHVKVIFVSAPSWSDINTFFSHEMKKENRNIIRAKYFGPDFAKNDIVKWWNGHSDHYLDQFIEAESGFGHPEDLDDSDNSGVDSD